MKKAGILAVIFLCAGVSLSAQFHFSAGVGGIFDASFINGHKSKIDSNSYYRGQQYYSPGGLVFFDLTYIEANVSFAYTFANGIQRTVYNDKKEYKGYKDYNGNMLQLGFSLLGKYPISLGKTTFFPLVGASYDLVLSGDINGKVIDEARDFSQFGVLAGVGFDFDLSNRFFLRTEALANLRFPSSYMKAQAEAGGITRKATFGIGPEIKLGLGFRIF
ncbi:MAG: outer membrane beta-barrel protein [Treponema sp.]|jgi:outer membrane protein W|nr:outer membrane beta-barrel protein [Treponema sp.]